MSLDVTTLALAKSYTNQHSGSGGSVPKPLTYDYMPEGYPTKTVETVTLLEEQQVAFKSYKGTYVSTIKENPPEIVVGQTYIVKWDGTEYECVSFIDDSNSVIGNLSIPGIGDDTGEPFFYFYDEAELVGGFMTLNTSASHTISVKRIEETVTPMAEEYLPENLATKSEVEAAQTTADTAQSTANAARSTANAAQSTANSIVPAAASNGVVAVKTITDIGVISGLSSSKKEYKAKGLNIKANSTVTVTAELFGSVSMIWDGYSAEATFPSNGPEIYLSYQVSTDTYTLETTGPISFTVEKMEYTEVPVSAPRVFALPYLQFSHILLYSNSGTGKLFKITVDDSGTLTATEVTST